MIVAAETAGVEHLVKISNLPLAALDSGLHGNHRAVERRLARSPVSSTVLQPSLFVSVLCRQIDVLRRGRLVLPTGDGAIVWIDPRDIAAVAATVLAGADPPVGPLRLTGPEALDAAGLARRLSEVTGVEVALVQPDLAKVGCGSGVGRHGSVACRVDRALVRSGLGGRARPAYRPMSSVCSGDRRVRSTSGSATSSRRGYADPSDARRTRSGSSTTVPLAIEAHGARRLRPAGITVAGERRPRVAKCP